MYFHDFRCLNGSRSFSGGQTYRPTLTYESLQTKEPYWDIFGLLWSRNVCPREVSTKNKRTVTKSLLIRLLLLIFHQFNKFLENQWTYISNYWTFTDTKVVLILSHFRSFKLNTDCPSHRRSYHFYPWILGKREVWSKIIRNKVIEVISFFTSVDDIRLTQRRFEVYNCRIEGHGILLI